jgi:hypothetical protein
MNGILTNLKRAEYTISRAKSQFYMPKFRVVGFICDVLERHSNTFKIIKIMKWLLPNNVAEVKVFIKVTIYYKMFIKNFTLVAAPIYSLIKKNPICLEYGVTAYYGYF